VEKCSGLRAIATRTRHRSCGKLGRDGADRETATPLKLEEEGRKEEGRRKKKEEEEEEHK
jgi:hypothetical protein